MPWGIFGWGGWLWRRLGKLEGNFSWAWSVRGFPSVAGLKTAFTYLTAAGARGVPMFDVTCIHYSEAIEFLFSPKILCKASVAVESRFCKLSVLDVEPSSHARICSE